MVVLRGSLTYSLLITPGEHGLRSDDQGALSITTALALCDAIRATASIEAGLKWPNDVLFGPKKLAGVLLESPCADRLVIGIGLNVNNRFESAPDPVRDRAVSLAEITGAEFSPGEVLAAAVGCFHDRLQQLSRRVPELASDWNASSILNGRVVCVSQGAETIVGKCLGVSPGGALRLDAAGAHQELVTGEVRSIDPPL